MADPNADRRMDLSQAGHLLRSDPSVVAVVYGLIPGQEATVFARAGRCVLWPIGSGMPIWLLENPSRVAAIIWLRDTKTGISNPPPGFWDIHGPGGSYPCISYRELDKVHSVLPLLNAWCGAGNPIVSPGCVGPSEDAASEPEQDQAATEVAPSEEVVVETDDPSDLIQSQKVPFTILTRVEVEMSKNGSPDKEARGLGLSEFLRQNANFDAEDPLEEKKRLRDAASSAGYKFNWSSLQTVYDQLRKDPEKRKPSGRRPPSPRSSPERDTAAPKAPRQGQSSEGNGKPHQEHGSLPEGTPLERLRILQRNLTDSLQEVSLLILALESSYQPNVGQVLVEEAELARLREMESTLKGLKFG